MRLQHLVSQLLLFLLFQAVVYAHLAATLSQNIPCTTNKQQLQELHQGDELLQCSGSAAAECGCTIRVARSGRSRSISRDNSFNNSESSRGRNSIGQRSSRSKQNRSVTDENGGPSGPFQFRTPWKQYLAGCRGVPGQQLLLLQQMGVNHIAPLLMRFFGFLHSALHLPVLLKRLKGLQHGVCSDGGSAGRGSGGWWSFGLDWDATVPLLRYFLSFLPFLLLLFSSLLLLLTSRSSNSGTVAAATEAAKTVSQARGSNSDAAYAGLLLLLPASCSKEGKHNGKRSVMLLLLIIATAAAAATLAAVAADSLKAAGCEAPLAFEAFSGLQQEQQQGGRLQRGLFGLLEGLRQLPTHWESAAPAAIAAARGYAYPAAPDVASAAPAVSTGASDVEVLLQEGATAAKQLKKSWLGAQYVLLLQTEPEVPPQQENQQPLLLLQGESLWRRSKRFLSSLRSLCRLNGCKGSTDGSSSNSNNISADASIQRNGSAHGALERFSFTPIPVQARSGSDTTSLREEEQQLAFPFGKQQQGLLRCMRAEELAAAASAVGDALDSALKHHVLMRQFVDSALEPHQLMQQRTHLLQLQQDVENALVHGLPQLWKFVRLLLQASSRSVEELLREMPLLLLAALVVAAAAAGASFVRQLAAEQPAVRPVA